MVLAAAEVWQLVSTIPGHDYSIIVELTPRT